MILVIKKVSLSAVLLSSLLLAGCITDLVTVPLGLAYDATKYTVKGTVAVVGGTVNLLTPNGDDKKDKSKSDDKKDD